MNKFVVALLVAYSSLISWHTQCVSAQDMNLAEEQRTLAVRFGQLESVLLRMAEINSAINPRRAALVKKVIAESKDRLVSLRFDELVSTLDKNRLAQAIEEQEKIEKDLLELLKLLESENREQRRNAEKEKLKEFLKEIDNLILQQRSLKGKTVETEKLNDLSKEQNSLQEKADDLSKKIANDQSGNESQKSDSQKSDSQSDSESGKNNDNDNNNGDKDGNNNENDSDKKQADKNQPPVQKAMQQAQRRMKMAEEQLEKAEKEGALQDQEEAIAELQKARAELERLLRQLREEEVMQMLQYLDARLRKMMQLEKAIRSQTEKLENSEIDARELSILSNRLGSDQSKVVEDADAALLLLREDGTARAMSESLDQARFDMLDVVQRLSRADVSRVTISVEDAIIDALQEMLDAVAQAKKDSQKRDEQNNAEASQQSTEDQNLIGIIAELRMIRTMQKRVNERTARYNEMLAEGKTDVETIKIGVDELTRQQDRIQKILRDLSLGKNR